MLCGVWHNRHSLATHLLESVEAFSALWEIIGHSSVVTTTILCGVSHKRKRHNRRPTAKEESTLPGSIMIIRELGKHV
jgi:hypothetical protein